jgi:hypothetical protein
MRSDQKGVERQQREEIVMRKTIVRQRLFFAIGAITAVTSIAASARDVVALRRGTYVDTATACAEASNATMRIFTGRGFDGASADQCVARPVAGKPGTYTQTCNDDRIPEGQPKTRSTETFKLRILSPTSYAIDGARFRLCPGEM